MPRWLRDVARAGVPMLLAGVAFAVFAAVGTRLHVPNVDAWRVLAGAAAVASLASGLFPRRRRLRAAGGTLAATFIVGYGFAVWQAGGAGAYGAWVQIAWATTIAWSWGRADA